MNSFYVVYSKRRDGQVNSFYLTCNLLLGASPYLSLVEDKSQNHLRLAQHLLLKGLIFNVRVLMNNIFIFYDYLKHLSGPY